MLVNPDGKVVNVSKKLNSTEHPGIFRHLREFLVPSTKYPHKAFNLGERATFKE